MIAWQVVISDIALKELKKLGKQTASLIVGYIEKRLVDCKDPRAFGKSLAASHSGKWRYRIGDYRLLCLIDDEKNLVTVIALGHRRDIYDT